MVVLLFLFYIYISKISLNNKLIINFNNKIKTLNIKYSFRRKNKLINQIIYIHNT